MCDCEQPEPDFDDAPSSPRLRVGLIQDFPPTERAQIEQSRDRQLSFALGAVIGAIVSLLLDARG